MNLFKRCTTAKGLWLDYGRDNYGVTWSNISEVDGRKLFIGWMSNWDYAQKKYQQKHGEVV
jgi:levanase/fructan beta-fructosidase